jgi:hypothetical protein
MEKSYYFLSPKPPFVSLVVSCDQSNCDSVHGAIDATLIIVVCSLYCLLTNYCKVRTN